MMIFMLFAGLLLSALTATAAPGPATDGTPCAGPGVTPRCPTGQTCCFSALPEFPDGICLQLAPDQVCAF